MIQVMQNHTSQHQVFPPTQWSVVLSARADDSAVRSRALEQICNTYWHPIYAYARKSGMEPEDAEDITQSFFASLLKTQEFEKVREQKGKLRTFLLVAVRNFMANEWNRRKTQKRGGGATVLSIDLKDAENQTCIEPRDDLTPEAIFERDWATTMLHNVMCRMQQSFDESGKGELFENLKEFLALGRGSRTYHEVGAQMGLSESAVKVTVHRMRKRYRELLLQEIEGTLEPGESAEAELRYLFGVFQS